jgi:hypothetical protein
MYNRNETNGKCGAWGNDIEDLVLNEIIVFRDEEGRVSLTLEMES